MPTIITLAQSGQIDPEFTLKFRRESSQHEFPFYDDGMGKLWVHLTYLGPIRFIRAQSESDAWEIALDESDTIPDCEVHEAYGFNSQEELSAALADGEEPELIEGYEYQGNSTGSGIVSIDLNGEYVYPVTAEWLEREGIEIVLN